jgi:predicted DNA-binding transcriptional regulator AlpA
MSAITWHRPDYQGNWDGLINLGGFAKLAGVSRAAVSNWRKRHDDFPKPVMTAGQSVWVVRAEVETWLSDHTARTAADRAVLEAREARQTAALATTRKKLHQLDQNH